MLATKLATIPLTPQVTRYLRDTLGVNSHSKPWPRARTLPFYLQDAFSLEELQLDRHRLLLAIDRDTRMTTRAISKHLETLRSLANQPVVYVTAALTPHERRRLIDRKVPFIVPNNQLYLPDLGLDLRERFRAPPTTDAGRLMPAAQALLISWLTSRPRHTDWHPVQAARALGYTPMTVSRAVRAISAAGLGSFDPRGKERWIRFEEAPETIWMRARPLLRSPVQRTIWPQPSLSSGLWDKPVVAGLQALAHYTLLAEPQTEVYALHARRWRDIKRQGVFESFEPVPGASTWQVWSYDPTLGRDVTIVDPFSLTLSLQGATDERVESALADLEKRFPW